MGLPLYETALLLAEEGILLLGDGLMMASPPY